LRNPVLVNTAVVGVFGFVCKRPDAAMLKEVVDILYENDLLIGNSQF
jgi:hypothetical protein